MAWETMAAMLGFALATLWTPGPNNIMLATSGANFGFLRTAPHALGVSLGFAGMMFCVALGLGEIFRAEPRIGEVLKWVGAGLLLYLGWRIATAGRAHGADPDRRPWSFLQASAFQWINPKAWTICISISSQFVTGADPVREAALCAALFAAVGLTSSSGWTVFGVAIRRFLSTDRRLRIFNITMGALLAACVVLLFMD